VRVTLAWRPRKVPAGLVMTRREGKIERRQREERKRKKKKRGRRGRERNKTIRKETGSRRSGFVSLLELAICCRRIPRDRTSLSEKAGAYNATRSAFVSFVRKNCRNSSF
jgi:hypothetical protein